MTGYEIHADYKNESFQLVRPDGSVVGVYDSYEGAEQAKQDDREANE